MEEAYRYANKNLQEADIPSDISRKFYYLKSIFKKYLMIKPINCVFSVQENMELDYTMN